MGVKENKKKEIEPEAQIGNFVVKVFEDSRGNLWFGTLEFGVAKYDGRELTYYTKSDGLPSNRVVTIVEDIDGHLWFGTDEGISRYDGSSFSNFGARDGICDNRISILMIDSKQKMWVGTWAGLCSFEDGLFSEIALPKSNVTTYINRDTENWITEIKEDSKGTVWVGRDGYGAYAFNGREFRSILKSDGLLSNNVMEIEEDEEGHMWFGTRVGEKDNPDPSKRNGTGGVNRMIGDSIISFPDIAGFNTGDVYEIHKDKEGMLWICTTNNGVYRFKEDNFENFEIPISIMSMVKDNKGNLWLGGAGGLYKINVSGEIINVTKNGPWN